MFSYARWIHRATSSGGVKNFVTRVFLLFCDNNNNNQPIILFCLAVSWFQVDLNDLDPKLAYIQVTHVKPYFCKDELESRQNFFEQNHDMDTFQFETPFTRGGSARGNVEDQWKRRTILTSKYCWISVSGVKILLQLMNLFFFSGEYSFPYVLNRIPVKHKQAVELSPIEVAIDEMQIRVAELEEVVMPPIDVKKLQLRLQGSVAVTVNAGPLAYAMAFLDPKTSDKYSDSNVEILMDVFKWVEPPVKCSDEIKF